MKVYISGPITGLPDGNKKAFKEAADLITKLGNTPINPHDICKDLPDGSRWAEYMKICLVEMLGADQVMMLPGYTKSEGAMVESNLAYPMGIEVVYYWDVFTEDLRNEL